MTNPFKVGDSIIVESGMSKKIIGKAGAIMYVDGEFCEVELEGRKDYDRLHYLALSRLGGDTSASNLLVKCVSCGKTANSMTMTLHNDGDVCEACDLKRGAKTLKADYQIFEPTLPTKAEDRKATPVFSGVLKYFPDAIREVAKCSKVGNDQHNPDTPVHWDRSKSGDELDALSRHLLDAGAMDDDGIRHSTKVAWRALANLQKEIEKDNGHS